VANVLIVDGMFGLAILGCDRDSLNLRAAITIL
jgi:hypothetical protein